MSYFSGGLFPLYHLVLSAGSQFDYNSVIFQIEGLCISVVERIKDALGWPGEVPFDADMGAWIGAVPSYLRNKDPSLHAVHVDEEQVKNLYNGDIQSQTEQSNSMVSPISNHVEHPNAEESSSTESLSGMNRADFHTTAQDIASFQVCHPLDVLFFHKNISALIINTHAGSSILLS